MTIEDVFDLSNDQIYKFEMYTGKIHTGILIDKIHDGKYYIVASINIGEFNSRRLTWEEKITEGILLKVNIQNIENWEVFQ